MMTARARVMEGMRFMAESGSGHIVTMDASLEHGGADLGCQPMELLLVGLAGCMAMDVIAILRKKRQEVRGYTIAVFGMRAEMLPRSSP
jgi:putative redox protein